MGLTGRAQAGSLVKTLSFSAVWTLYCNGVPPKGSKSQFVLERSLWQQCAGWTEEERDNKQ